MRFCCCFFVVKKHQFRSIIYVWFIAANMGSPPCTIFPTSREHRNIVQLCTKLVPSWQPGCEKREREWGNEERFTLFISSFSLYFLPLYPFLLSKIVSFCRKMLNTVLLLQMSQKQLNINAMRKWFWIKFIARKLRKLWGPKRYKQTNRQTDLLRKCW